MRFIGYDAVRTMFAQLKFETTACCTEFGTTENVLMPDERKNVNDNGKCRPKCITNFIAYKTSINNFIYTLHSNTTKTFTTWVKYAKQFYNSTEMLG